MISQSNSKEGITMMPVTHIPTQDASHLPLVYFSRVPPDGGSGGGGKRPASKPARKPAAKKKAGGGKTTKKRK
jgi:hypothetical protein